MSPKSRTENDTTPEIKCTVPWRVRAVSVLENYKLNVVFVDGMAGIVELEQIIMNANAGVFASLRDIQVFKLAYVEHGAVTWPGGIDLAPDVMYDVIKREGVWRPAL